VSAGGEKAVGVVKHWQRVASEKAEQLRRLEPLQKWVDRLESAENVGAFLDQYDYVMQHPAAREAVLGYLRTNQWGSQNASGNGSSGNSSQGGDWGDDDDDLDPTTKQVAALTREVMDLRGGQSVEKMKSYLNDFFNQDMAEGVTLNSILSDEEKTQIASGMERQCRFLAGNAEGQKTLRNLQKEDVERMLQLQLPPPKWVALGERAHLRKIELKRGAATGAAPAGGTTGGEGREYGNIPLHEALAEWCKDNNVDPYNVG